MNETIFFTNPGQGDAEQSRPMLQEAGLGASVPASEAAIEQIVAEKQSEAGSPAYVFVP